MNKKRKGDKVMQKLIINGGNRLHGNIKIQGAKNAALPIMAACILCKGDCVLKNCPQITDIYSAMRILTQLGCTAVIENGTAVINADALSSDEIPDRLMREMRSSVFFLGALTGRTGNCRITYPGGCDIGRRPIDIHISALKKMGAEVSEEHGIICCKAENGLHGARISLSFPSVGATENIILAAVLAKGTTTVTNAAREPEIADLAQFLNKCGARIYGAGSDKIVINGVKNLDGCEYTIMPDRIAAATYLACAAAAGGEITVRDCVPSQLEAVIAVFEQIGCLVSTNYDSVMISSCKNLKAADIIRTTVYPGFPTDTQAFIMAALCKAEGTSVFVENIFENRYRHADGFRRMGADIRVEDRVAVVTGVKSLYGAKTDAPDLRGGAGLVAAALSAQGESEISSVEFIDRGYENIEAVLSELGADIKRV